MDGQHEVIVHEKAPVLDPPGNLASTKEKETTTETSPAPKDSQVAGETGEEKCEEVAGSACTGSDASPEQEPPAAAAAAVERDEETEMAVLFEVALIRRFDRSSINVRQECWFLMDAHWLNHWASYVQGQRQDRPGPITNARLFEEQPSPEDEDDEGQQRHHGRFLEKLRAGLRAGEHYRAVTPTTWFIYVALYGKDRAPEVCRYTVDVYGPAVPLAPLKDVSLRSSVKARIEVGRMRAKLRDLFPGDGDEGPGAGGAGHYLADPEDRRWCCCCWVRREQLECALFWMFTYCVRLWPWHYDHSDSLEQRVQGEREMVGVSADDDKQLLLEEGRRRSGGR